MLVEAKDIKDLGLNSNFWNISDTIAEGEDFSELDKFLRRFIVPASERVKRWLDKKIVDYSLVKESDGVLYENLRQAELYITLANLLPVVWSRAGVGEASISFDGMSIAMARVSPQEQELLIARLVFMAEGFVLPWIEENSFGGFLS